MLTINACRKLLPKSYASKSDKEIELMRNQYYQMAAFMFDVWHERKRHLVVVKVSIEITYRFSIVGNDRLACPEG
ncbi:MAG: hypothetical protein UV61_C0025G0005 [Candidatus Gottesmanbacteria bacterium GW2011_GWB1_43_11]|uniref:Uncharacterized protein n=1 Tax=Candidatus Gottesmanbacteria bacterium GW2011_GWB1_43_11 TaxID=1618446 RepID=A0A0G1CG01_9BACT|nr:MAG: hypothetical protein UV61_C0025G0005 [Candidatus Gottesmanbacteria bacterium GW2011_GWB1_43_11]